MDVIDRFDVKEELTNENIGMKAGTEINPFTLTEQSFAEKDSGTEGDTVPASTEF